jgi:hypothetical protein
VCRSGNSSTSVTRRDFLCVTHARVGRGAGMTGKNRIMIYGPKDDGTYVVEFRTSEGDVLATSIPRTESHVIRHFQERMPYTGSLSLM